MKKYCKECFCKEERWIKVPELGIKLSSIFKIDSKEDIVIPSGHRLPTYGEYAYLIEKKIIPCNEKWIEYCTSPLWKGIKAVWLDIGAVRFDLSCNGYPILNVGRARGVRFVRNLKKVKK